MTRPGEPTSVPLSDEDRAILELECGTVVGHVVHIVVLGGPPLGAADLAARIADRLSAAPELRYRLAGTAGAPVWHAVEDLDPRDHVADVPGGPHDEAALNAVVVDLFARHLDRGRPLWAIDVVPLRDGRTALVWRMHHAVADGATTMRLARTVLYDEGPTAADGSATTGPSVSPRAVVAHDHRRRRDHLAGMLAREFPLAGARSPFDGAISTRRAAAFLETELAPLHAAAHAVGATVNDAVLSVLAGGLRRWVEHHAGQVGDLRARIPVCLPHADGEGNRDSAFDLPLPMRVEDPVERLRAVHELTARRKRAHDAQHLDELLHRLADRSPSLRRVADRLRASPRSFAVSVSNVPGPREPVAVLERPVRSVRPLVEVGAHHALRVSTLSTAGTLAWGVTVDPTIVPEVGVLAEGLRDETDALVGAPLP